MEDIIIRVETTGDASETVKTLSVMVGGDPSQAQSADYYKLKQGWKLIITFNSFQKRISFLKVK